MSGLADYDFKIIILLFEIDNRVNNYVSAMQRILNLQFFFLFKLIYICQNYNEQCLFFELR